MVVGRQIQVMRLAQAVLVVVGMERLQTLVLEAQGQQILVEAVAVEVVLMAVALADLAL